MVRSHPASAARYKERLELKYMRTNPKAAALNGKKWMFVRSDMDDLRSGVPVPMTEKDMVIKVSTYSKQSVNC